MISMTLGEGYVESDDGNIDGKPAGCSETFLVDGISGAVETNETNHRTWTRASVTFHAVSGSSRGEVPVSMLAVFVTHPSCTHRHETPYVSNVDLSLAAAVIRTIYSSDWIGLRYTHADTNAARTVCLVVTF
jgi:hypothetical protein